MNRSDWRVGPDGRLYVADTWNRRIQVFQEVQGEFVYLTEWVIDGWEGQSTDTKPYLAVSADGRVWVTDPGNARVLVFDADGNFLFTFGTVRERRRFLCAADRHRRRSRRADLCHRHRQQPDHAVFGAVKLRQGASARNDGIYDGRHSRVLLAGIQERPIIITGIVENQPIISALSWKAE